MAFAPLVYAAQFPWDYRSRAQTMANDDGIYHVYLRACQLDPLQRTVRRRPPSARTVQRLINELLRPGPQAAQRRVEIALQLLLTWPSATQPVHRELRRIRQARLRDALLERRRNQRVEQAAARAAARAAAYPRAPCCGHRPLANDLPRLPSPEGPPAAIRPLGAQPVFELD